MLRLNYIPEWDTTTVAAACCSRSVGELRWTTSPNSTLDFGFWIGCRGGGVLGGGGGCWVGGDGWRVTPCTHPPTQKKTQHLGGQCLFSPDGKGWAVVCGGRPSPAMVELPGSTQEFCQLMPPLSTVCPVPSLKRYAFSREDAEIFSREDGEIFFTSGWGDFFTWGSGIFFTWD